MIKLSVKKLLMAKGITDPHAFLVKIGINGTTATRILNNRNESVRFEHLELILWHAACTPDELFEWLPDRKFPDMPGHPIQQIRARHGDMDLPKYLKRLTKAQLAQLRLTAIDMLRQNEGGLPAPEKKE